MLKFLFQIGVFLSTSCILAQGNAFYPNIYKQSTDYATFYNFKNQLDTSETDSTPVFIDFPKSEIVSLSLCVNWFNGDFTEFGDEIGSHNADFLTDLPTFTSLEIAYYGKKRGYGSFRFSGLAYMFIAMFGVAPQLGYAEPYNDTLTLENRKLQFGIEGGYTLVKWRRMNFTPKIGINWNRYRLLNYHTESSIPLAQYAKHRELDVRFNQVLGTVGATMNINLMGKNNPGHVYWSIGFTGGYCFKLHGEPLVYTAGNSVASSSRIYYDPFYFSIFLSINTASY